MSEIKLKDCPYCGSRAKRQSYESAGEIRYQSCCSSGSFDGGCPATNTSSKSSQYLADCSWNLRVIDVNERLILEGKDRRVRLLELMLFKESGGKGYDFAIEKLSESDKAYYDELLSKVNGIENDLSGS